MSTLPKIIAPSTLLLALALCPRPAYSGSAGTAPVSPPPAATAAPAPPGALPPAAAPLPSSADQMVLRLNRLTTDDLRGAVPVLVIPAQEMTPGTYDRIVDDLSIMNRIIEKNTRTMSEVGGIYGAVLTGPGNIATPRILRASGGRPKPMYIGGYGAVFSLSVDFPLLPPEAPEPNKVTEKTDPTWAQAQRELQDPQAALRLQRGPSQGRVYRAEAVETLRNTLIGLFKHATNIRDLGPDAWLTILVHGPAAAVQDSASDSGSTAVYVGDSPYQQHQLLLLPQTRQEGRTLMTLRAKKADIDQYAKGQLDDTQFQQRVQIVIH
ncbi:MAG: hypothetical protein M1376_23560 [Planctomycetes bacterium]|nr:hypothetical protein [Planctomycetota bacterium]